MMLVKVLNRLLKCKNCTITKKEASNYIHNCSTWNQNHDHVRILCVGVCVCVCGCVYVYLVCDVSNCAKNTIRNVQVDLRASLSSDVVLTKLSKFYNQRWLCRNSKLQTMSNQSIKQMSKVRKATLSLISGQSE